MKKLLYRSHVGSVRNDLRAMARSIMKKIKLAGEKDEDVVVFVDREGDVFAARSGSGRTAKALLNHKDAIVGHYQYFAPRKSGQKMRDISPTLPSVDDLASDIGQHENAVAAVRAFMREAA